MAAPTRPAPPARQTRLPEAGALVFDFPDDRAVIDLSDEACDGHDERMAPTALRAEVPERP